MLSDGQTIMTYSGDVGVISHRGTTQTFITYWVNMTNGNLAPIHEDNLFPIDRSIYDIARECV